jgi:aryl-alcohol dehydrogenase-like predicted oxidoreductase
MDRNKTKSLSRRRFLQGSLAASLGLGLRANGAIADTSGAPAVVPLKIRSFRPLGRTGFKVSDIGLGSSGLTDPVLFEAALDTGINYLDCAEVYMGGQVERTFGRVLKHRRRDSVFLTTKIVVRPGETKESVKGRALKCLERLETDHVDCFMVHAPATSALVKLTGFHDAVRELKAEGRVKFCGISSHGSRYGDLPETMEQVLGTAAEDGRFDVMLFVYNFIQRDMGERLLKVCRERNIGAALMKTNPVADYFEAQDEVDDLRKQGRSPNPSLAAFALRLKAVADKAEPFRKSLKLGEAASIRDAAVKFVLANASVGSACVSIKNTDDLRAFVGLSGQKLSAAEMMTLAAYEATSGQFYCRHACGRCEGSCPEGIPVNTIMRYDHYLRAQGREEHARSEYASLPGRRADRCLACSGPCQSACPFGVPVQGLLALAHRSLSRG